MKHQAEQEEQHKLQLKASWPPWSCLAFGPKRQITFGPLSFIETQAKVREAMPTLINIFQTLDKDNSGNVTQEEPLGWVHPPGSIARLVELRSLLSQSTCSCFGFSSKPLE